MAEHRHRADHSARRETRRTLRTRTTGRRAFLMSAAFAAVVTTMTVSGSVVSSSPARSSLAGPDVSVAAASLGGAAAGVPTREPEVSRDRDRTSVPSLGTRPPRPSDYRGHRLGLLDLRAEFLAKQAAAERRATREAVREADTRRWATEDLTVWSDSGRKGEELGLVEAGDKVLLTGRKADGRTEVVLDRESRWVSSGYFSEEEPSSVDATCTNGSSVPSGVSPNIVAVHQAVCGNFPEITVYGTLRSDGEHSQGIAVDIMVSGDRGWQVAEFLQENYQALGINYVIYSRQIWQPGSSYTGWQGMEDRGSITANHYDHVHVTTY